VLDDVGREAVKPKANVDAVRDLVRSPLRWSDHLRFVQSSERGVGLGASRCECRDDVEDTAARVRGIGLRPTFRAQRQRLVVASDKRVLGVGAV
jgi:hypothetical protein